MSLIRKSFRYVRYYGVPRVAFKAYGRSPNGVLLLYLKCYVLWRRLLTIGRKKERTLLIGCGQYGFGTIGFFLAKAGASIDAVFDINENQCHRFFKVFGSKFVDPYLSSDYTKVYVASNHASHASYAENFLEKGTWVHIEKPVAVSRDDLSRIEGFQSQFRGCVGYNRPYSTFTKKVASCLVQNEPMFMTFLVSGHFLGQEHWYNHPNEGTRLLGNFSHWIDLTLYYLDCIGDSSPITAQLVLKDQDVIDDNITVHLNTAAGSRSIVTFQTLDEPVLGIQESHFYQQGGTIYHLKDYRSLEIIGEKKTFSKSGLKDVGHELMLTQPTTDSSHFTRALEATKLTLAIIDTGKNRKDSLQFNRLNNEPAGAALK